MVNINPEIFEQVVVEALAKVKGDRRWTRAIHRAIEMLDGNPYVEFRNDELLVMSDTSFNIYVANGSCQCEAFRQRQPCKHRALARLLRRYYELVAAPRAAVVCEASTTTVPAVGQWRDRESVRTPEPKLGASLRAAEVMERQKINQAMAYWYGIAC